MPEYHAMPEYRHIFLSPEYRHILSPEYRHTPHTTHHTPQSNLTEQGQQFSYAVCGVVVFRWFCVCST